MPRLSPMAARPIPRRAAGGLLAWLRRHSWTAWLAWSWVPVVSLAAAASPRGAPPAHFSIHPRALPVGNGSANGSAAGALSTVPAPCVQGSRPPITFQGAEGTEGLVAHLEPLAAELYEEAARYTGATDCAPILVQVVRDLRSQAGAIPAWHVPPWAAGAARPAERQILMTLHADGQRHDHERVFLHELTHVALAAASGMADLPRWFEEGVARRIAGEDTQDDDHVLASARIGQRLIPLEGLDVAFPGGRDSAGVAYAVSGRAIELLEARFGPGVVREITAAVRHGRPFDDALLARVGLRTWQLSGEVERSVQLWHAWLIVVRDVDIWMALGGLILVFGGLRARARIRAAIAEMEDPLLVEPLPIVVHRWRVSPSAPSRALGA